MILSSALPQTLELTSWDTGPAARPQLHSKCAKATQQSIIPNRCLLQSFHWEAIDFHFESHFVWQFRQVLGKDL